jgi:hypothetical protein
MYDDSFLAVQDLSTCPDNCPAGPYAKGRSVHAHCPTDGSIIELDLDGDPISETVCANCHRPICKGCAKSHNDAGKPVCFWCDEAAIAKAHEEARASLNLSHVIEDLGDTTESMGDVRNMRELYRLSKLILTAQLALDACRLAHAAQIIRASTAPLPGVIAA